MSLKDYRLKENRWDAWKMYHSALAQSGDMEPHHWEMDWYFDRKYAESKEDQHWWCWLFAVTDCLPTVLYIVSQFPHYPPDMKRLRKWHDANWRTLHYETDRRHCKGHLMEMLRSYMRLVGRNQDQYFNSLITGNPQKDYETVSKELDKLNRFGHYSILHHTETVMRCTGLPIECTKVGFGKKNKSSTNGILLILGLERLYNRLDLWTPELCDMLEWYALRFAEEVESDLWYVETSSCIYKGLYVTRRRYLGFYIDDHWDQGQLMQERTSGEMDWDHYWQMRKDAFPSYYLGEVPSESGTWSGVRKHLCDVMSDTGCMVDVGHYHPELSPYRGNGYGAKLYDYFHPQQSGRKKKKVGTIEEWRQTMKRLR